MPLPCPCCFLPRPMALTSGWREGCRQRITPVTVTDFKTLALGHIMLSLFAILSLSFFWLIFLFWINGSLLACQDKVLYCVRVWSTKSCIFWVNIQPLWMPEGMPAEGKEADLDLLMTLLTGVVVLITSFWIVYYCILPIFALVIVWSNNRRGLFWLPWNISTLQVPFLLL
jgi:hypothetical protein